MLQKPTGALEDCDTQVSVRCVGNIHMCNLANKTKIMSVNEVTVKFVNIQTPEKML